MSVPPWPVHAKDSYLQVVETPFGFQQRVSYQQADLYHEEVVDLDTPFAQLLECSQRVHTTSVLLLGDQNAGKTTFLHVLVYEQDAHFTELTAHLPVLAGTFINTRLLPPGSSVAPMDEPPFLDTDLARTSLLFSMDDWNVFLEEHGLPPCPSRAAFFVLQLVEIGGDHLDRLMRGDSDSICAQSRALIARVDAAAYIVNGRTGSDERMAARFAYIRSLNPRMALSTFVSRGGADVPTERQFCVLDPDGHAHVAGIVQAVANLVALPHREVEHAAGVRQVLALAAERLVHFWQSPRANLYLDRAAWYTHLSSAPCCAAGGGENCVPDATLPALFDDAAARLAAAHLAIVSRSGRFSDDFAVVIEQASGGAMPVAFGPCIAAPSGPLRLRFPVFEPLFDVMCAAYVRQGVPSELWLTDALLTSARAPLEAAVAALEARAQAEWPVSTHAFLLLLEDWLLAQRRLGNVAALGGAVRFPRALAPHSDWDGLERLLGRGPPALGVHVVLTLETPH